MEYLHGKILQSAINVYEEVEIRTPSSKTEVLATLIHEVDFHVSGFEAGATVADVDAFQCRLTKKPQTTNIFLDNPDLIAYYELWAILGTVFNSFWENGARIWKFDPPILYPRDAMYLAVKTQGFAMVRAVYARVGYTLERVSSEDFIAALVE